MVESHPDLSVDVLIASEQQVVEVNEMQVQQETGQVFVDQNAAPHDTKLIVVLNDSYEVVDVDGDRQEEGVEQQFHDKPLLIGVKLRIVLEDTVDNQELGEE